jgi:acyl-CoA thioester hydrolase
VTRSKFHFFCSFRVRYSELDTQGVVFNAHYLAYFDTALIEYFHALGIDLIANAAAVGVDFHVVRSLVEYKAPIRYRQEIEVGVRVAKLGRTSLSFELAIFARDSEETLATGEVIWVNTDQATHQTVPISDDLRRLLTEKEPHLAALTYPDSK